MSFYNEYRPHQFRDILGQEQVVRMLQSQARARAFHHAYLMFGASGTGKTTTARILAAALNCYSPDEQGEPCGACASCEAVAQGRHWDVIEVDGTTLGHRRREGHGLQSVPGLHGQQEGVHHR